MGILVFSRKSRAATRENLECPHIFPHITLSYMETTSRHYSGSPVCDPSYSHLPQRWASGAAKSGSEARTDAVRRRLHAFVKRVIWHGHPDLLISFG